MFLTEAKLEARIRELQNYRYRDAIRIPEFAIIIDTEGNIAAKPPAGEGAGTIRVGEKWRGRDLYAWLMTTVTIPREWTGRKAVGRFDFGRTGGGNNSGFESLLFLNGQPYQGVDSNHEEVFLPASLAGQTVSFSFRLWSGLEGGGPPKEQEHTVQLAEVAWLDEDADDLYYTSRAALETIKVLDPNQPERIQLLSLLNRALKRLDWSQKGDEAFYESVRQALAELKSELAETGKQHPVTVTCIGHTHIDVAWLWQLKHTREKCARSFSTVLRLMEMFPDYIFLQTQPQLYEYMKEDYPEIYAQIRERVQEGRWEAGGGMWLEADCNLTSGESLVRQILYGTRFLREEFGVECRYLWLPDVFGYSWALPQILRKSGLDTFMTTKISWNQYNRMPHDTFRWRGIDGTEVLTHFITTPEPWSKPGSWFYTYNGRILPATVKGIWDAYRDKNLHQELLLSYGYGDGGGGVNREMLEMRRRLDTMPGLPQVKTGRADDYFERLQEAVNSTDEYVHTWDGELYLEYHRGTYTSQAYNKRMNRKLELLYRETEWLGVAAAVDKGWPLYRQKDLYEGWKIILRNQFHDIIPGSSIREVYEDSRLEYEEAEQIARDVRDASFPLLLNNRSAGEHSASGEMYTVYNSTSWERADVAVIPAAEGAVEGSWTDATGEPLRAQFTGTKWLVEVPGIPAMGWKTISYKQLPAAAAQTERQRPVASGGEDASYSSPPFETLPSGLRTPFYEIEWGSDGQLTRIFDRDNNREVLAAGQKGNVLQVFEDKPLAHEAWDIDLFYQEKKEEISDLVRVEVIEEGPLRAVVQFTWTYNRSKICQQMIAYTTHRRIDFYTEIDWHERQRLLKTAFPVEVRATEATYDIQFGNVKRPTHWNTSWDWARFETAGHQWADLSEHGYGVSLLNDCKYGYDIKDNVLRLSLIKSAVHPDTEADQGEHRFTYSLLPHKGDWLEGFTVAEAWNLNNPLTVTRGINERGIFSLFHSSCDYIVVDTVKKAEDADLAVVRLHEFAGGRHHVELSSDLKIVSWQECDLLERPAGEKNADSRLRFEIRPYEIKTFLVEFAPGLRQPAGNK
ncbi:alpha-mannosidase [Paenibacillus senegalensis]|uniref:alpha-mannosidase n=1 Tax=Paenibacillus senegalensis TaxID=1465766 RepID=UPI000288093C|nr:alpha-mannosidase [Paenibacillus senegalensis]